ncbi:MAG: hypothetical protein Q9163_006399, partial [Psora crenata]
FRDDFVKSAETGGQEAAHLLRSLVINYIQSQVPDLHTSFDIVVYVYANVRGLTKAYSDAKVIQQHNDLERFIRGFNMAHALVNLIDAGEKYSDTKLHLFA